MAGGLVQNARLSVKSSHRKALLRNLVTSLVKHEAIQTTYPKAKAAQRVAEKLITLAKRNNETSRRAAMGVLFTGHELLPKLFGELRERYATRPGGYTRVLRTEPKDPYDQAPSAILELVDGKRDMRFAMTAAAVARDRHNGFEHNETTLLNMEKVTRFRKDGDKDFGKMVDTISKRFGSLEIGADEWERPVAPPIKQGWWQALKAREAAGKPYPREEVKKTKKRRNRTADDILDKPRAPPRPRTEGNMTMV